MQIALFKVNPSVHYPDPPPVKLPGRYYQFQLYGACTLILLRYKKAISMVLKICQYAHITNLNVSHV